MSLTIYNTLTRQKEAFKPEQNKVRMFVCGPTVYDFSHIGHARTYIAFDAIANYLRYLNYDVFYLQNITDIDDKIIERAKSEHKEPLALAKEFTDCYLKDMLALGINSVTKYASATEYIPQIIDQVKRLIEKGHAYIIEKDGYYFDLQKSPAYGKLSGRTTAQAEDAISRIDESSHKHHKGDFALWKFSKDGEPSWPFADGASLPAETLAKAGRPGWHIEDTAISEAHFGPQYELHGGARDLIFPHHEAEIAQMEALSGLTPFVQHWLHSGFLSINGQKMSKSLGNFITIRDILHETSPEALRFFVLSKHYRSPIDYHKDLLKQAEAAVSRLGEFLNRLKLIEKSTASENSPPLSQKLKENFEREMNDDFNTPKAVAQLFDTVRQANTLIDQNNLSALEAKNLQETVVNINQVLGIIPCQTPHLPNNIQQLVKQREQFRQQKKFSAADDLRQKITAQGYTIEDTLYGPLTKLKK